MMPPTGTAEEPDLIAAIEEEDAQGMIVDGRERARTKVQRTMAILLETVDVITAVFVTLGTVSK
jgi:hypothetical protein